MFDESDEKLHRLEGSSGGGGGLVIKKKSADNDDQASTATPKTSGEASVGGKSLPAEKNPDQPE